MGRFLVAVHAISFYVEISLAIYVICLLEGAPMLLILALLAASIILCNFISAVLVNQTMDFYRKPCNLLYCIVLHVGHLGLLWRYIKSVIKFNRCHNKDMMKLELLHHCIFSVPVILYMSRWYLRDGDIQPVFLTLILSCFVSTTLTLSYFNDFQCKNRMDHGIWLCTLFWKSFMLFARFSVIMWALESPNGLWAGLMMGVHFVVLMIWYQLRNQDQTESCSGLRVWLVLLAIANTIDLTISDFKVSIQWLIGFYALMLGENIAMIGIWYSSQTQSCYSHQMLWLAAVFASFTIGLLLSLVVMTMSARESQSLLQLVIDQGCSCLQSDENDSSFLWDTSDIKQRQKCHNNKAFVIEEKQKHVDILNNPLGVADVVSLTTAATTGPSSPTCEIGVESPSHTDHLRRPLPSDKQEPLNQPAILKRKHLTSNEDSRRTVTSPPFFLSPTGLRAHRMNCRKSEPSLATAAYSPETTPFVQLPALAKPRRRLLFLTPNRLSSAEGCQSAIEACKERPLLDNHKQTKSISQHDLRPRWVDLNKYYYNNSFSSLHAAAEPVSDHMLRQETSPNKLKVESWLNSGTDCAPKNQTKCTSKRNKTVQQYETPL